jgi:hypothetical protein
MVYHESQEPVKGKKLQSSTQLRSTMTIDSLFTQAEEGLHGKLNVAQNHCCFAELSPAAAFASAAGCGLWPICPYVVSVFVPLFDHAAHGQSRDSIPCDDVL